MVDSYNDAGDPGWSITMLEVKRSDLMTTREVMEYLGVNARFLTQWRREADFTTRDTQPFQIAGTWIYLRHEIETLETSMEDARYEAADMEMYGPNGTMTQGGLL